MKDKMLVEELFDSYYRFQRGYYDEKMVREIIYVEFQGLIDEYVDNKIKEALINEQKT